MRLLLDSSYFLSYFKITLEELPYDFIRNLINRDDIQIQISEISYAELVAKSFKLNLMEKNLKMEDIISGLDSLRNDIRIHTISWYENPKIFEITHALRAIHSDFFDCIIYSSAILEADAIGTFDITLFKKIKNNKSIIKIINEINPEFEFWLYNFKGKPKKL